MFFWSLLFCSVFLTTVSCQDDLENFYDMILNVVVNIKELEKVVRDHLPVVEGGMDPMWIFADSWATIPSGVLAGNLYNLGHFDECYKIHIDNIYGKYCLGSFILSPEVMMLIQTFNSNATQVDHTLMMSPTLHWATCVPHTVAAADIPGMINYTENFCYSKADDQRLSSGAIATITILVIGLVIVIISTTYDFFLYYNEKKPSHELLIAFSFLTNGRNIFSYRTNQDHLLCLNGIKALSMMWVIIGHEFFISRLGPIYNLSDVKKWKQNAFNMPILGGTLSVDSFFVVSGLTTVYTFLTAMDKRVKFNVILFYLHRYLRLTPALAIMVMVYMFLLNYIAIGPLWYTAETFLNKQCEEAWWSTLLYITNYVQRGNCLPQAWYLSVDMQLHIFSPVILLPLCKWPKRTLKALGVLAVVGCIIPFSIAYSEQLNPMDVLATRKSKFMVDYYNQTYARFSPYVIGMITGFYTYQIRKKRQTIKLPKLAVCGLWTFSLAGLVACVYAGHPIVMETEKHRWGDSLYLTLSRPCWAVALAFFIFLCVSGYGQPINKFLSLSIFQFLAKTSYSMYLVHYAVIIMRYCSMKSTFKFSNVFSFYIFWADFMLSLVLSVILCLTFESPIIILTKYIFGNGPSNKQPNNNNKINTEEIPKV